MIKYFYITFFIITCTINSLFGQEATYKTDSIINSDKYSSITKIGFLSDDNYHFAENIAKMDIENGDVKLFLIGGISPSTFVGQRKFEKKYKIEYYDFGDLPPQSEKSIIFYNRVIFEYLTEKHGEKWKKKVRPDVIGLKKTNTKR